MQTLRRVRVHANNKTKVAIIITSHAVAILDVSPTTPRTFRVNRWSKKIEN